MQEATIDVIIPAYNAQDFIVQAIDSVKSQSYTATKMIVVDDGSTDLTPQIVKKMFAGDASIFYVRKDNGGLSSARNRGIAESKAAFIAFLDADDVWLPTKLSEQMEIFHNSKDPKLGLVYCGYRVMDRSGKPIPSPSRFLINPRLRGEIFDDLLSANRISGSGSAVLIRRQCLEVVGGFDESLPTCEDWDMWLRLARHYHFDYVDKPMVEIRRHAMSMQLNQYRMFSGYILFFNKWLDEASKRPGVLSTWRREYVPPMIAAMIKEFPSTSLYRRLTNSMSSELKHLASTQISQIAFAVVSAFVRKTLHR